MAFSLNRLTRQPIQFKYRWYQSAPQLPAIALFVDWTSRIKKPAPRLLSAKKLNKALPGQLLSPAHHPRMNIHTLLH